MSLSNLSLALFLVLHSLHLGLAMELPLVTWIGGGAALLGSLRLVTVERPTRGLIFVLLAVGAIGGSQVLEDWAVEGSWPQTGGMSAGLVLALLSYQLWLFAARTKNRSEVALDSDTQTILALGLPLTLLISPPDSTVVFFFGAPVALITVGVLLLASIALLADRCAGLLMSRLALLLPLTLLTPVMVVLMQSGQAPMIEALGGLLPKPRQSTRTGFSPYQQLSASVFLRPTNGAVMRIETDALPSAYLVGNRLVRLDKELRWQPSDRRQDSPVVPDAESLTTGEWRYQIDNHHFNIGTTARQSLTVRSLSSCNISGEDAIRYRPTSILNSRFTTSSSMTPDSNCQRRSAPRSKATVQTPATLSLWQRFLSISNLPAQASWTGWTYANNLPADWPSERKSAVREFLEVYNLVRFSDSDDQAVRTVEKALEECSGAIRNQ